MTIVHPQQPVNGLNPEDVFYAIDDLGAQTGYGFILYQLQPGLYPDCPVNLYFSIDGDPASRYLLFGALVARARVLQSVNPQLRCRLYTSLSPSDVQMKDFYLHNGFDCDETDEILQLTGRSFSGRQEALRALRDLHESGIPCVVLSLGAEGALLVSEEGALQGKPPRIRPRNTVGCGDSMVAGFAVGFARGLSVAESFRMALAVSAAGALSLFTGHFEQADYERLIPEVSVSAFRI